MIWILAALTCTVAYICGAPSILYITAIGLLIVGVLRGVAVRNG